MLSKDFYYTNDHEWVDFNGKYAYVGVCKFKLTGIGNIKAIEFHTQGGLVKKGQVLATVISDDYNIPIHMPVDGWFVENNKALLQNPSLTCQQAEKDGWIALIKPVHPYLGGDLMNSVTYRNKHKPIVI